MHSRCRTVIPIKYSKYGRRTAAPRSGHYDTSLPPHPSGLAALLRVVAPPAGTERGAHGKEVRQRAGPARGVPGAAATGKGLSIGRGGRLALPLPGRRQVSGAGCRVGEDRRVSSFSLQTRAVSLFMQ